MAGEARVTTLNTNDMKQPTELKQFIRENADNTDFLVDLICSFNKNDSSRNIIKAWLKDQAKVPVIVTADNKELFNTSDIVYGMHSDYTSFKVCAVDALHEQNLYFSTPESRQTYIDLHKPKLSVQEVMEVWDKLPPFSPFEFAEHLKQALLTLSKTKM